MVRVGLHDTIGHAGGNAAAEDEEEDEEECAELADCD